MTLFLLLLDNLLQFGRHRRNVLPHNFHFAARTAAHDDIELAESLVLIWIIFTEMTSSAFTALECRAGDSLGNRQEIGQIQRRVPAAVVFAVALHSDFPGALSEFSDLFQRHQHFRLGANDPDQSLHLHLQLMLNLIWTLSIARTRSPFERLQSPPRNAVHLIAVDRPCRMLLREACSKLSGTFPEDEQVRQRITAKTICAMKSTPALPGSEEA